MLAITFWKSFAVGVGLLMGMVAVFVWLLVQALRDEMRRPR